ncbi:MAG: hypothetical protein EOO05_08785 [Chitinophagaceae bacterium]|nr:MAG: hypothetical protein EOO05_08785 [Chitinophagaceae bacterium]
MLRYLFSLAFCAACLVVAAQRPVQPDAESEAFFNEAMAVIKPAYKNVVQKTAAGMKGRDPNVDSLVKALKKEPALAPMPPGDIEAMAFLVMMQASKLAEEDLKNVMAGVKKINQQKPSGRTATSGQHVRVDSVKTQKSTLATAPVNTGIRLDSARITSLKDSKDAADSQSDLSQQDQLRLQMLMDRRSKMMEVISNLMKKMSDTSDQIIGNLK